MDVNEVIYLYIINFDKLKNTKLLYSGRITY